MTRYRTGDDKHDAGRRTWRPLGRVAVAACLTATAAGGLGVLAGCYSFGVEPPPGVKRVAVPIFRNDTFPMERGLELELTRAVRRRIEEQSTCILVSDPGTADAVLDGTVKSYRESVQAEDTLDRPVRSVATAQVFVRFRRTGPNGEVFFAETFPPERVAFLTGAGRDTAKEELVQRIADKVLAWAFTTWE